MKPVSCISTRGVFGRHNQTSLHAGFLCVSPPPPRPRTSSPGYSLAENRHQPAAPLIRSRFDFLLFSRFATSLGLVFTAGPLWF